MPKKVLIDGLHKRNIRVAVVNPQNQLDHFDFESPVSSQSSKGDVFLAKVVRIENSLQAVFVDYGAEKNGFLPLSEVHPEYFQISKEEKSKIMSEIGKGGDSPDGEAVDDSFGIDDYGKQSFPPPSTGGSMPIHMRYNATEVIRKGQVILVQVTKEERGSKGSTMTTYISLAGRFFVLMYDGRGSIFVSRRIGDYSERQRVKDIVKSIGIAPSFSIVVRTAALEKSREDFTQDYSYLAAIWNSIRDRTIKSKAPAFIHGEDSIIRRTIREYTDQTVDEVVIEGNEAYGEALKFCQTLGYDKDFKIIKHSGKSSLFDRYGIEGQLSGLLDAKVQMSSGASLVINQTEALVSIDVNSGKSNNEANVEDTAMSTNLDATKEIARQLRLRNLSGIIVIDFIDMSKLQSRKTIEKEMREALLADKARIQLSPINSFGLLILSRQRTYKSFFEASGIKCESCLGGGFVKSPEYLSMHVLRSLSFLLSNAKSKYSGVVEVRVASKVLVHILNFKRSFVKFLEDMHSVVLSFYPDDYAKEDEFRIGQGVNDLFSSFDSMDDIDTVFLERRPPEQRLKSKTKEKDIVQQLKHKNGGGIVKKLKSFFF